MLEHFEPLKKNKMKKVTKEKQEKEKQETINIPVVLVVNGAKTFVDTL